MQNLTYMIRRAALHVVSRRTAGRALAITLAAIGAAGVAIATLAWAQQQWGGGQGAPKGLPSIVQGVEVDILVAADGSGDFTNLQTAFDNAPANAPADAPTVIGVASGTYAGLRIENADKNVLFLGLPETGEQGMHGPGRDGSACG